MKKVIATILATVTLLSATTLIANAGSAYKACLKTCFDLTKECIDNKSILSKDLGSTYTNCTNALDNCLHSFCLDINELEKSKLSIVPSIVCIIAMFATLVIPHLRLLRTIITEIPAEAKPEGDITAEPEGDPIDRYTEAALEAEPEGDLEAEPEGALEAEPAEYHSDRNPGMQNLWGIRGPRTVDDIW